MSKNITILKQLKSWSDQIARSNKPLGWEMQNREEEIAELTVFSSAVARKTTLYSKRQEIGRFSLCHNNA